MKVFKRIAITGIGGFVILLVGLYNVAYVFEDEIIAQAKIAINESVDTRIDVAQIDFSLIQNFPNASLLFQNVTIEDKLDTSQNLLFAELVSLEFDIIDLVQKKYSINNVKVNSGIINMKTRQDGEVNFVFWKSGESPEEMRFDIEDLKLKDMDYTYIDEPAEVILSSHIIEAQLNVGLEGDWFDLVADLTGTGTELSVSDVHYLLDNDFAFEGQIKIDKEGKDIYFTNSLIDIGPVHIPISGRVFEEENWKVDLHLLGNTDIKEFLAELPMDQKGDLDKYSIYGQVVYDMTIKGESTGESHPVVEMEFELKKGAMTFSDGGSSLKSIAANGKYSRSSKGLDKVQFFSFNSTLPQGDVAFSGSIEDFNSVLVNGKLTCTSNITDLLALTGQQMITESNGSVHLELDLNGRLPNSDALSASSIRKMNMFGIAELEDVNFSIASNGYRCEGINTQLILKDNSILLDELSLTLNGDPLELSGSLSGIWDFAMSQAGILYVKTDLQGSEVHWDQWTDKGTASSGLAIYLPINIEVELSFKIDQFVNRKFKANEIKGMLTLRERTLQISPLTLSTCGGDVGTDIHLSQQIDKSWKVDADGSIAHVDVSDLFRQFEGFGQNFLTADQLKGKGDAMIGFSASMDSTLTIDHNSISSTIELKIVNGELIEHPSMIGIIDELREKHLLKPFVRADELEREMHHLRFERLSNTIRVEKGLILIPKMDIANNAMDIGIKGVHGFDRSIDYTVDFTLRDILINKRNPEFLIQDDGLGHRIHLKMRGTVDDPIIEMDKDAVKENRREAIVEAKEDILEFFSNPFKKKIKESDDRSAVVVEIDGASKQSSSKKELPVKEKKAWWKLDRKDVPEEKNHTSDEDDW